jgi:hypothetical protein
MYGIKGKHGILCWTATRGMTFYFNTTYNNPVIKDSPMEIDQLLQALMADSNDYSMIVFEFTPEEEQEYIIKKLKGH